MTTRIATQTTLEAEAIIIMIVIDWIRESTSAKGDKGAGIHTNTATALSSQEYRITLITSALAAMTAIQQFVIMFLF